MLSVDLRFAVKARPGDGWWSSLVEQKWGENIGDALERARRDREGKILLAPPIQASELSFEGPLNCVVSRPLRPLVGVRQNTEWL